MVLIFREKSVFFIFQSPKRTNYISLISRVSQKLAGQTRSQALFKDGRQTPDWCVIRKREEHWKPRKVFLIAIDVLIKKKCNICFIVTFQIVENSGIVADDF